MKAMLKSGAAAAALMTGTAAAAQSDPPTHGSAWRYDAAQRVTGTIGADPDGTSGTRGHAAARNSYDIAGNLVKAETGTLAAWQSHSVAPSAWTGFTIRETIDYTYDAMGRRLSETLTTEAGVESVTQMKYDAAGRLDCTAVRMKKPFGSLPESACVHQTPGNHGPDRIVRNSYDPAGRVWKIATAFGTAEAAEESKSFTPNGKLKTLKDGEGNLTTLEYDPYDRVKRMRFPSKTKGAGTSSASDYEEYAYDLNGNRKELTKRDGKKLTYDYDALNRLTVKTAPVSSTGAAGYSVHHGYDLRGLQLYARFGSPQGPGITNSYDGAGRLDSTTTNMGGTERTTPYGYDGDGNRTRVGPVTGGNITYAYDAVGAMKELRASGNLLIAFAYDAAGRRESLKPFGTGAASIGYQYHADSRLWHLTHNFNGTTFDETSTFTYNAAGQIVTRESRSDEDRYAFTGAANVDRDYQSNGLNQYQQTLVGGSQSASFDYDDNGNLWKSTTPSANGALTTTYAYDAENRLASVSGQQSATLAYDPLGRLWQVSGGGVTTSFMYDGDRLQAEFDGNTLVRSYAHGPGSDEPLVWWEMLPTLQMRFLHHDHQGSVVAIGTSSRNNWQINAYDEYGMPQGTNVGRFQYTGQAWLNEIRMYYYKARIYSPALGRFLQTDPIGYEDGANMYAYVGNDPVNERDPTGLCRSISDKTVKADCLEKRDAAVDGAKEHLRGQSVKSGTKEAAYIAVFDESSGTVAVRTGDAAGIRTPEDVFFKDEKGSLLRAQPDGRIVEEGKGGVKIVTKQIVLATGHGHTKENSGGAGVSKSLDRANESLRNNPNDRGLSRIAPAVIKTPSGKIKVFINGKEVQ